MDATVAWASRIYPDPETAAEILPETEKQIKNFVRQYPTLSKQIVAEASGLVVHGGRLGHIISLEKAGHLHVQLNAFAARVGFALYRHIVGVPLPFDMLVSARWLSNHELDESTELNRLLGMMGAPSTLFQGRKEVSKQFRYWASPHAPGDRFFACFAAFRESFGIMAVVDPEGDEKRRPGTTVYKPGFLQSLTEAELLNGMPQL